MERFTAIQDREQSQRTLAVEDALFAHSEDGMWGERETESRKDRPRYTINRVAPAIDQICGDQKQNRTSIKVRPSDGAATKETAKVYDGLIRSIESLSQAENAYDSAFEESVTGGFGGWRLNTEYANEESFDQDIRIRPVKSAATSLWFGPAVAYDKRDADHAFYTSYISVEEYKKKWPKAGQVDFDQETYNDGSQWYLDGMLRIAEYWVKTPVKKKIARLSDGRIIDVKEDGAILDELASEGIEVIQERTVDSYKIEMYILSGSEVLTGPQQWAGRFIPLVPLFGKTSNIEGEEFIRGIVRFSKDPNRIYNYATSANIEAIALAPKDPYWLTATQVGDYKTQFETFNQKNQPFLFYKHDPESPGAPQRTGAPSVQTGLLSAVQQAGSDIEATTGMYAPAMGNALQLLSEKSIASQAEKGDRGSFIFSDNLQKSIAYTGDILVDLIPRIYDTEQTIRILGADGVSEIVDINKPEIDGLLNEVKIDEQTGEEIIFNDLARGLYDITVTSGPAYATRKAESLAQMNEFNMSNPQMAAMNADLIIKSMDLVEGDEMYERARKALIQQGMVEPTEEEVKEMGLDQPAPPDPQAEALIKNIESQTQLNIETVRNKQADTDKKVAETVKTHEEANLKKAEAEAQELENDMIESGVMELIEDGKV